MPVRCAHRWKCVNVDGWHFISLPFPLLHVSFILLGLEIDTKLITLYCMFYYRSWLCAMERFTASFVIATLDLSASVEITLLTALRFITPGKNNEIRIGLVFAFKPNADSVASLSICRILSKLLTTQYCN